MHKLVLGCFSIALAAGVAVAGGLNDLGDPEVNSLARPATLDPQNMPLLAPGSHVGMIVGFNPTATPAAAVQIEARWDEAVNAGMRIGRVQLDWVDLEPDQGQYDFDALVWQLDALADDGLQPFLLLSAFDNEGSLAPADLRERIASGEIGYNHPDVLNRFGLLLEEVVPELVSHGGWVLSVMNEPGNVLDDLDPAERLVVTEQLVEFVSVARAWTHAIEPRLAVTATIREGDPANELPFLAVVDVASYNFYCSRFDQQFDVVTDPAEIAKLIDTMIEIANGKSVIFQELGCHAGRDDDREHATNATERKQQLFYEAVFSEMENRPKVRAAVIFQLIDWDPELVETYYSEPFRLAGLPEWFIEKFAESLESVGLLRYWDGKARPAWDTFLDAL